MEQERKIAVLIDADNVSQKYIKYILDEIAKHGLPTYKRIYGDWTSPQLARWKDVLLDYSITPIQQYSYTAGKNSTDSALIIDAMDILYSHNINGFCIVSSDSDFTRLVVRLRESGMYVVGMGEKKTPKPFIAACEQFKYLEALAQIDEPKVLPQNTVKVPEELKKLTRSIRNIITDISDEDGWASMSKVGNILNKREPDFDPRNYGYPKLTSLVKAIHVFEVDARKTSNPHVNNYFIKNKETGKRR